MTRSAALVVIFRRFSAFLIFFVQVSKCSRSFLIVLVHYATKSATETHWYDEMLDLVELFKHDKVAKKILEVLRGVPVRQRTLGLTPTELPDFDGQVTDHEAQMHGECKGAAGVISAARLEFAQEAAANGTYNMETLRPFKVVGCEDHKVHLGYNDRNAAVVRCLSAGGAAHLTVDVKAKDQTLIAALALGLSRYRRGNEAFKYHLSQSLIGTASHPDFVKVKDNRYCSSKTVTDVFASAFSHQTAAAIFCLALYLTLPAWLTWLDAPEEARGMTSAQFNAFLCLARTDVQELLREEAVLAIVCLRYMSEMNKKGMTVKDYKSKITGLNKDIKNTQDLQQREQPECGASVSHSLSDGLAMAAKRKAQMQRSRAASAMDTDDVETGLAGTRAMAAVANMPSNTNTPIQPGLLQELRKSGVEAIMASLTKHVNDMAAPRGSAFIIEADSDNQNHLVLATTRRTEFTAGLIGRQLSLPGRERSTLLLLRATIGLQLTTAIIATLKSVSTATLALLRARVRADEELNLTRHQQAQRTMSLAIEKEHTNAAKRQKTQETDERRVQLREVLAADPRWPAGQKHTKPNLVDHVKNNLKLPGQLVKDKKKAEIEAFVVGHYTSQRQS